MLAKNKEENQFPLNQFSIFLPELKKYLKMMLQPSEYMKAEYALDNKKPLIIGGENSTVQNDIVKYLKNQGYVIFKDEEVITVNTR